MLPMLSLFKREYPKGEGVIRSYNTKVLSKLLHRKGCWANPRVRPVQNNTK